MGPNEILHRYVPKHEIYMILIEVDGGATSGRYAGKATAHKILRKILWWPTLHKVRK